MSSGALIAVAAGLVVLAGLFAMTDSALSVVSPARAAELARDKVRGAKALQAVASDVGRHLNLLLLLRLICELCATTMVALVTTGAYGAHWEAALLTVGSMVLVSFVVVGVGTRSDRPPARLSGGAGSRAAGALARPCARPVGVRTHHRRQRGDAWPRLSRRPLVAPNLAAAAEAATPLSSCASWSIWPSDAAWWSTKSET